MKYGQLHEKDYVFVNSVQFGSRVSSHPSEDRAGGREPADVLSVTTIPGVRSEIDNFIDMLVKRVRFVFYWYHEPKTLKYLLYEKANFNV